MPDVLLTDLTDGVAVITLNRPDQRNALNNELRAAIPETLTGLDADDDVAAFVLTGADPAFCAGLDLKEIGAGNARFDGDIPVEQRGPLPPLTKPLIGAVNGAAVTGGFELALNCDFLIASERATFADTHTRVGVHPGWGLSVLLPQAVGVRRATQMSMTGDYIDARRAYDWGLVNEVVPHDSLLDRCLEIGRAIGENDREGVPFLLATYRQVTATTVSDGWAIEADRARAWGGFDPAKVEERRARIMERGRSQQ